MAGGMDDGDELFEILGNSLSILSLKSKEISKLFEQLYGKERKFVPSEFTSEQRMLYKKIEDLEIQFKKKFIKAIQYYQTQTDTDWAEIEKI